VGRVFADKFCLREKIGSGANGSVYRADQTSLGRTVAVKVMKPEIANDPRFIRKFHDEARAASRLNHPNVVSVIDFGQTSDGLFYLVMEYLHGVTLTDVMRQERLSIDRIADIISQVLSALEEAHEGGVVHADLKTDNTMVERRRGGWDLVKVVDFGIARLTGKLEEDDGESDDSIFGTPEYMAPEIIRGDESTPATDIYAVGIMLYELLVGKTPFADRPTLAILEGHLKEVPEAPGGRAPMSVPAYLEEAVLRALEKRPADRFVNANSFAAALVRPSTGVSQGQEGKTCSECGVTSAGSFKFCPECGARSAECAAFELEFVDTGSKKKDSGAQRLTDSVELEQTPRKRSTKVPTQDVRQALVQAALDAKGKGDLFPLPMLGRQKAQATLAKIASSDEPCTILICGPRGSGRTRLLLDTCEAAVEKEKPVYLAPADPTGQTTPLYPFRAMVAGILQLTSDCSYEELGDLLNEIGLTERDLPGIGELFQIEGGGLWELELPIRRREVFAATARLMRAASDAYSAVFAFEDCHLYDSPSQDLVRELSALNERTPSLRILASSDENEDFTLAEAVQIELEPLDENALCALVSHIEDCGHRELITIVDLKDKGVPAHLEQLVRYAVEAGDLQHSPEGLADLIAARADLLPQVAKRVLQAAAVFGLSVVESDLVAALASSVGRIEMDASLKLLSTRSFLKRENGILWFEASMVREVIYEATPLDVRRSMHNAAGDTLKTTTNDPAILGLHAERAGDLWRASELLSQAGDSAAKQFDDRAAAAFLNRSLNATRTLLQREPGQQLQLQLVDVSIRLSNALQGAGDISLATGILNESRGQCGDSPALRIRLHRASAKLKAADGDIQGAIEACREAISMAMRIFELDLLTETYLDLATMLLRSGEPEAAATELEESIDLITVGEGPSAARAPSQFWRLLLRLGQLLAASGKTTKARSMVENAARLARVNESSLGVARANMTLANILDSKGDARNAQKHRQSAIHDMRLLGDRRATAELLLASTRPTENLDRFKPADVEEARMLAEEVGWDDGVRQAKLVTRDLDSGGRR
jgi:serine/threonine-protein kinase